MNLHKYLEEHYKHQIIFNYVPIGPFMKLKQIKAIEIEENTNPQ